MSWAAAAIGAASTTMGAVQYFSGRKKAKQAAADRPDFEIPQEIQQNVQLAKQQAMEGMPEAARQRYMRDINRGQAQAYTQAGSRKAGLTGISAINQQGQDAAFNIAARDAEMMQQNQARVFEQQDLLGQYKAQQWELNELNPNLEKQAAAQAMMGAGIQNIGGGLQTGALAMMNRPKTTTEAPATAGTGVTTRTSIANPYAPPVAMDPRQQGAAPPTVGFTPPGMTDQALTGVNVNQNAYQDPFYTPQSIRAY